MASELLKAKCVPEKISFFSYDNKTDANRRMSRAKWRVRQRAPSDALGRFLRSPTLRPFVYKNFHLFGEITYELSFYRFEFCDTSRWRQGKYPLWRYVDERRQHL